MNNQEDIESKVADYQHKQYEALKHFVDSGKLTEAQVEDCNRLFTRFYREKLSEQIDLDWSKVKPLPKEDVLDISSSDNTKFSDEQITELFSRLVVLKLNGGVGTSMGCAFPKSCIKVKNDLTFLHVILKQINFINTKYHVNIPLVFMNSGRTEEMTKRVVEEAEKTLGFNIDVRYFNQPVFPRADEDTCLPTTAVSEDNPEFWYPPGHASVLESFIESGLGEMFIKEGKQWVFISNSDNLGAVPDGNILGNIVKRWESSGPKPEDRPSFFLEATAKTHLDIKGGTPILYDDVPFLLEASQVPKGRENEMYDIEKFTLFNSGNIWINLQAWQKQDTFELPIIYNPKIIKGDKGPAHVIQLETGVGAAISLFKSVIMAVPRSRFIPVKLTCDLFRLQSDLYVFQDNGKVEPTTDRAPIVTLSKEFAHVKDYEKRVKGSISLKDAQRVVLDGDIVISGKVRFEGDVEVHREQGSPTLELTGTVHEEK